MRKPLVIIVCFLLAAVLWFAYQSEQLPPGLESKGVAQDWLPWVTLIGAIVSLIAGILTLILKVIELRQKKA